MQQKQINANVFDDSNYYLLEMQIIRSMCEYPMFIKDFMNQTPIKVFSPKGQYCLQIIENLNAKEALSNASFLSALNKNDLADDYFVQLVSLQANANYEALAGEFVNLYKINTQRNNAFKLLEASAAGEILDYSMLEDSEIISSRTKTALEWQQFYEQEPPLQKIQTGVTFLDSTLGGGFEVGQLVVIMGDAEAGKTALGVQILENASSFGNNCVFFNLEFLNRKYIDSIKDRKDFKKFATHLRIEPKKSSIYDVVQIIKNEAANGCKLVLIDSQMRLECPKQENIEQKESFKFSTLAKLAMNLEIVIILIAQNAKGDKESPMGSIKGAYEPYVMMRVEHDKASQDMKEIRAFSENTRIITMVKNKQNGNHFKQKFAYDKKTRRFSELDEPKGEIQQEVSIKELRECVEF